MSDRRWFLRLCMLTMVLALIISSVLMVSLQGSSIGALQSGIDFYRSELTGMRLVVIGVIALIWPKLIQYAEQSGRIGKGRSTELTSMRWRIISWLLVIELLLGQDLVWHLIQAVHGIGT